MIKAHHHRHRAHVKRFLQPWEALDFWMALPPEYQVRILEICVARVAARNRFLATMMEVFPPEMAEVRAAFKPDFGDSKFCDKYAAFRAAAKDRKKIAWEIISFLSEITPAPGAAHHPLGRGTRLMAAAEEAIRTEAAEAAARAKAAVGEMRRRPRADASRPHAALSPSVLRRIDPVHHRRRLRTEARDARQFWQAALGAASKKGKNYCSDFTLSAYLDRQKKGHEWAASQIVFRDGTTGICHSLAAIKDASIKGRLARLYAMSRALEAIGEEEALTPIFLTLTLGSEWHPHPTTGFEGRAWKADFSPALARCEMQILWERLRARLEKAGVKNLGVSVKEPHADGTPHQHAMLWVPEEKIEAVKEAVRRTYPGRRQAEVRVIERGVGKASPASYLLKYILETLPPTGAELAEPEADLKGKKSIRVRAQMAEMGVRRVALLGVHGVQKIWQSIITASDEELSKMPARARVARLHMDAKRWADALAAMGALEEKNGRLVSYYEKVLGRYGDAANRWAGFFDSETGELWISPRWSIMAADEWDRRNSHGNASPTVRDSYPRGRPAATPGDPDPGLAPPAAASLPLPMAA